MLLGEHIEIDWWHQDVKSQETSLSETQLQKLYIYLAQLQQSSCNVCLLPRTRNPESFLVNHMHSPRLKGTYMIGENTKTQWTTNSTISTFYINAISKVFPRLIPHNIAHLEKKKFVQIWFCQVFFWFF